MQHTYDLAIIGGGVAGLSAAINASSEGIKTIIVDKGSFGGQAGSATLIENVLGYPNGVTGKELINNALAQALKFGTDFKGNFSIENLVQNLQDLTFQLHSDEETVVAKSVLITAGLAWRPLETCNANQYIGRGVAYGSPSITDNYEGQTIAIVGGANSAGQAAMFLASCPNAKVILIVRAEKETGTMSHYLAERVTKCENLTICTEAEVMELYGEDKLESIKIVCKGETQTIQVDKLFILIGAKPRTGWLRGMLDMDAAGFIKTGRDVNRYCKINTTDYGFYETALLGVFAAGDVRYGAVRRVSNALGEGASAVNDIHKYLQSLKK